MCTCHARENGVYVMRACMMRVCATGRVCGFRGRYMLHVRVCVTYGHPNADTARSDRTAGRSSLGHVSQ